LTGAGKSVILTGMQIKQRGTFPRFMASNSAGSRRVGKTVKRYAVIDRYSAERVAWYATFNAARADARRRNEAAR